MQLYSAPHSPYAARCRIQIGYKQLPVAIVPPPEGMGSAALKAKNPSGKIPVLVIPSGRGDDALGESWAILEYLEARFPSPAMRPADPLAMAQIRARVRFTDLYLAPAMFPLFLALRGSTPPEAIATALGALTAQLQTLEAYTARAAAPAAGTLDLADAALLPILWYARVLARHFDGGDVFADCPALGAQWGRATAVPAAAQVLNEMEQGLRSAMPSLRLMTH